MPDHCNHNHPDFEEPTMTITTTAIQTATLHIHGTDVTAVPIKYNEEAGCFIMYMEDFDGFAVVDSDDMEVMSRGDDPQRLGPVCHNIDEANELMETLLDEQRQYGRTDPVDENGQPTHHEYWERLRGKSDKGLDGQRITCARALAIAHDMMHAWLADGDMEDLLMYRPDIEIAASVLHMIRAQRGCEHMDSAVTDGYMTHLMDVIIYG